MNKVVSVEQMRALERGAETMGLPGPALMENAGRAVATEITRRYPCPAYRHALILVGPGNNGGDGLVVARHLHDSGYAVLVYLVNRSLSDADAKIALLQQRGVGLTSLNDDTGLLKLATALGASDLIVDAILGTGRARPIEGVMADVLDRVNQHSAAQVVVAVDLPTGVNADTGQVDPHVVRASLTVTLSNPKRGLLMGEAVAVAGELVVADIGIPDVLATSVSIDYAEAPAIARLLPVRSRGSHKGTFGRVIVVAGSARYTGAPVLAALGAERSGAGLVTLACPASVRASLAAHTLETTFLPLPDEGSGELAPAGVEPLVEALSSYEAMLVGPGIGRAPSTQAFLGELFHRLVGSSLPVVIDADALTLLSQWTQWWERLPKRSILTPHEGEMARLIGSPDREDRIDRATAAATAWHAIVVLKGPYTIVAEPDGHATIVPFATPALATAGTGDVLAGTILGLLGQGLAPGSAAIAGAYVHGLAGDLMGKEVGLAGGLAADLARIVPRALAALRAPTS